MDPMKNCGKQGHVSYGLGTVVNKGMDPMKTGTVVNKGMDPMKTGNCGKQGHVSYEDWELW